MQARRDSFETTNTALIHTIARINNGFQSSLRIDQQNICLFVSVGHRSKFGNAGYKITVLSQENCAMPRVIQPSANAQCPPLTTSPRKSIQKQSAKFPQCFIIVCSIFSFYRAMHFSAKRGIAIACRLSVRLSVTLVDCDHIGWNSSKIISPLVSLGRSLFANPTWRVCSKGNTPKFGPKVTHPLLIWASETFDRKLRPNGYR